MMIFDLIFPQQLLYDRLLIFCSDDVLCNGIAIFFVLFCFVCGGGLQTNNANGNPQG